MRCPACHQSITETEAACAQCGFSLDALAAQMGIPPQLTPPVADLAQILSSTSHRALARAVNLLEQRFPDIEATVVIAEIPPHLTPETYSFWLFNRTSLFSETQKGGDNHGVLLLFDATTPKATVTIGYGLEPFVPEPTLELCLRAASHSLLKSKYVPAAEAFFREMERQFTILSTQWPTVFGYTETTLWLDSATGETTLATQAGDSDPY